MPKTVFTTSDFSRKSGDMIAAALREPVTITQRDKPRLVLLNVDDYERLMDYADHRKAYTLETIPEELFEEMKVALEDYANEPEE